METNKENSEWVEGIISSCEAFLDKVKGIKGHTRHYEEIDGEQVLCGIDATTCTPKWGIGMTLFLDGRNKDMSEPDWWKEAIRECFENFDVDNEIDLHRESPAYRKSFSIRQSLEDFEEYEKFLWELADEADCYAL